MLLDNKKLPAGLIVVLGGLGLGLVLGTHQGFDKLRVGVYMPEFLPFGIPANSEMLLRSDHLKERGYFVEVEHPATGKIRYPGAQVKMGDLPYELKRAPFLGEHNREIYQTRLGYSTGDLVRLREQGVI